MARYSGTKDASEAAGQNKMTQAERNDSISCMPERGVINKKRHIEVTPPYRGGKAKEQQYESSALLYK